MTNRTADEEKLAAIAYNETLIMLHTHVSNGFMPEEVAKDFARQSADDAVEHFRKTGEKIVYADERDPRFQNEATP